MNQVLLISVRLHEGRYHGSDKELPAPARLFQALVAGAGLSGPLCESESKALEWLEQLDPPLIATPRMWNGQSVTSYVPNNDLDTVAGDQRRIGSVKTSKVISPRLFDAAIPLLFAWSFLPDQESDALSTIICEMANHIYQFGRGVDFAWAWGETLDEEKLHSLLATYPGRAYHPTRIGTGVMVACPQLGSWYSLKARHEKGGQRFVVVGKDKSPRFQFTQAPKPRFAQIAYDSPPTRTLFELCAAEADDAFSPYPLEHSSQLITVIRDTAVERLRAGLPEQVQNIERALIGRRSDGTNSIPATDRVRIIPLPSIGHFHADAAIRRVLIEVPATCPLRSDDVSWAMSGMVLAGTGLHFDSQVVLRRADSLNMLSRYGINCSPHRTWWSVTPVVLPENVSRRRIDPSRTSAEAKSGSERRNEQENATAALAQSLRHANILTPIESIRLQREPFIARGQRVEEFATGTRFAKERLWHTQITFKEPVSGPVIIGDGRFLGLGIMAPNEQWSGIYSFHITAGLTTSIDALAIAGAMRRAVMSRVQCCLSRHNRLPPYFSGHDADGSPTSLPHLTFVFDALRQRLLIIAPHIARHQALLDNDKDYLTLLDQAVSEMSELRVGSRCKLLLASTSVTPTADPIFGTSATWVSVTDYVVTRHLSLSNSRQALTHNIQSECERLSLPRPNVLILEAFGKPGLGLSGRIQLTFPVAIDGPLILGRNRHLGGGVFARADNFHDQV